MPNRIIHYADDTIDRAAQHRDDTVWLDERLQDATTRFVAVASGRHLITDGEARRPHYFRARDFDGALPGEPILLGLRGGVAFFAVDATDAVPPLPPGVTIRTLRDVIVGLGHGDSSILAYARSLVHWNRTHRFCGACGAPTESVRGGHVRRCAAASCGREHFPRSDPAVITLVIDGDRCLLARRFNWAPGRRSTIAGFVEPGETLEHAVVREVLEEVGVRVGNVRYRGSQPWPFPQSLMLGFRATAESSAITVDGGRDRRGGLVHPGADRSRHRRRIADTAAVRFDQPSPR